MFLSNYKIIPTNYIHFIFKYLSDERGLLHLSEESDIEHNFWDINQKWSIK